MTIKTAIYETDVQGDFALYNQLFKGALFVRGNDKETPQPFGAEARLPNVYAIHKHANENKWLIAGSVDRHFYEDAELIRNKGGVFDDHCMNGTLGQLRLAGLEPQKDIYIRSKDGPQLGPKIYTQADLQNYINAAKDKGMHLIFEKQSYNVGTNKNFEPAFKKLIEQGLENVIIDGFATDYCVLAAGLKMADIRAEYQADIGIYVVTDAIKGVNINFDGEKDPEFSKKALDEMKDRGIIPIKTKDVLEGRVAA
ncbi:isochorismatase family protein [Candidatus Pacearchaeota archaeon]|nr:isochorismatase family protein [Candidatus Pacearchaeota archaeon]